MEISQATPHNRAAIISLLQSQNLPAADLPLALDGFFTAIHEGRIIGLIGLERYGQYGLLRSMVVHPEYRKQKIAERLVCTLEDRAAVTNIQAIYLLTETAEAYFTKRGYTKVSRDEVPPEVRQSSEFNHVCPVSATVMAKRLAVKANLPL